MISRGSARSTARHPTRALRGVALLIAVAVLLPTTSASAGNTLRVFGPENEAGGKMTLVRARRHARAFRYIVARPLTYAGFVGAMRRTRPNLVLEAYVSGTFLKVSKADGLPEDWFAHDVNGGRIRSRLWSNYLMDPSSDGWVRNRITTCRDELGYSHYTGCFVDMLGTEPLTYDYVTSLPIDPATGAVWTRSDWLTATTAIATRVHQAIAPKPIVVNGIGSGWRYFDPNGKTSRLFSATRVGMAEEFVRAARAKLSLHRPVSQWLQDVRMLIDAGARGHHILAYTKVWLGATTRQLRRWHQFALATFMLGNDGDSYFSFSPGPSLVDPHPWWSRRLGDPMGRFFKADGVYQRRFRYGRVLANPSGTEHRIWLGGRTYRTLTGDLVRRVTLRPYAGAVLKRI